MATLNRLHGALAVCALVTATASSAYAGEPTLTDPPSSQNCEQIPADCPGAQAQKEPTPAPAPQATPPPPMIEQPWYETLGYALSLGAGVDGFVSSALRDLTSVGGSWDVRLTAGTRSYVAFEASYIGSAQSIDTLGLSSDAHLIGNGLQAALRVNVLRHYVVQPFVYVGAAWRHYELSHTVVATSDVNDADDVFELPVGVGLASYFYGFMADVRAEYRVAWSNDLVPAIANDTSADRWGVTGNVGMSF